MAIYKGSTLVAGGTVLGELSSTAYRGDRGKAAYDHSNITSGNPHGVTKSQVGLGNCDNTSDANKPVSTATQTALNAKANDNAVVKLTGNQSVGGTKTFSSNVVVPVTPTADAHAASKQYVDGYAVKNVANASGIKVVSSSTEIVSTTDNVLYFVTGS